MFGGEDSRNQNAGIDGRSGTQLQRQGRASRGVQERPGTQIGLLGGPEIYHIWT